MPTQPRAGNAADKARAKKSATRSAERKAGTQRMSSVAKALLVLECVGLAERRTLTEIAKDVRLPKSTLLRLIQVLIARGFLRRVAHGEYTVSLKTWQIGCAAFNADAIRAEVMPVLRDLVNRTGETAHYAAYEDGYSVYVEKLDGLHPVRYYTVVGGRSPAYATATGKALLAWRDKEEIARVGRAAERWTKATNVGAQAVLRAAAQTRRLGYAVNRGEWRPSVWGIGAPVFDRHDKVISAVGISGPADRIEPNVDAFAKLIVAAAAELSRRIGASTRPL